MTKESEAKVITSFRIPQQYLDLLDEYAREKDISRSKIIIREVRKLLKRVGKLKKGA